MRKLPLLALIISLLVLSGCSVSTDLAIVNLSDGPLEIRYQIKEFSGPFSPPQPAIKKHAELDDDTPWHNLDQYGVNSGDRTVVVILAPRTALRIDQVNGPGVPRQESFKFSEIFLRGANGTMMLQGEQLRKSFTRESTDRQVYSITYK